MFPKLQYISQGLTSADQMINIQEALDAGCDWIQLRFKNVGEKELYALAEKVKVACQNYKAVFIVNDHVELAKEIDSDGVHLGLEDASIETARRILGNNKIIGGTANTLNDVLKRVAERCDYIGLGPYRMTATKEKLSPVLDIDGYEKIMNELKKRGIDILVYAIGGIELEDVEKLMNTGVDGIAISGMITRHSNKKELVAQLKEKLYVIA